MSSSLTVLWEIQEKKQRILSRRMVKGNIKAIRQILIKWKGTDIIKATWEE